MLVNVKTSQIVSIYEPNKFHSQLVEHEKHFKTSDLVSRLIMPSYVQDVHVLRVWLGKMIRLCFCKNQRYISKAI